MLTGCRRAALIAGVIASPIPAAELSAITGAAIRARSPFPHTLVVTMVNGAAKYMPDAAAYRDITCEAMNRLGRSSQLYGRRFA